MFERYNERARRVIFFARYEASQLGSPTIETEHLLLGLLREDANLVTRFWRQPASAGSIRQKITNQLEIREKITTSVDLPLTNECKRILAYSAEEAERMAHRKIGAEHLLLGILREEKCGAAQLLQQAGANVETVRDELVRSPVPPESGMPSRAGRPFFSFMDSPVLPTSGVVPDADTAKQIAEAVWRVLYGAEAIESQKPLQADLNFNVWLVTGSAAPDAALFAFILKVDGRILSIGRGASTS